jgi:hypothetical protein
VQRDNLLVLDMQGGVASATLPYAADRIEVIDDRILISGQNDTSGWQLALARTVGTHIALGAPHVVTGFEDAERRTHGFNRGLVAGRSLFGLVGIREETRDDDQIEQRSGLFFEPYDLQIRSIGQFDATRFSQRPAAEPYDEPDWYGSTRIAFVGARVFMLAKWGLVEGQLSGGLLREGRSLTLDPNCCRR